MIKIGLIIIAFILTALGIYMSADLLRTGFIYLFEHPVIFAFVGLAIAVQLVGHWLRAMRTKLVLDQAAPSSMRFQFGALSVGYLFNTLLPLRIGELVRAYLVARRLKISFLYTFVSVVIERSIDVIFLAVLIIIGVFVTHGSSYELVFVSLVAALVALVLLYVLLLLRAENKYLLAFVSKFTELFNASISNSLRFKVWSLIFGLQNFLNNPLLVRRYAIYALLSWICYFVSAGIIVTVLLQPHSLIEITATSISPYVISFNPVDASSYHQLAAFLSGQFGKEELETYAKLLWIILTIPMAAIGAVALVLFRTGEKKAVDHADSDVYTNKLLRHQDISQELPSFLASYFSGNSLARILHKIEVAGELSLVRYFKGGSDAITVLVLAENKLFVKKIIPLEYRDRLKAQYDWLVQHKDMKYLVEVLGEQDTDDYYAIDLAYDPKNIPFFEYAHHNSLSQSKAIIDKVWDALYDHLHSRAKELKYLPKHRDAYIEKHIIGCVDKAAGAHTGIRSALKKETIVINGVEYDNLHQILAKIKKNKQAWRDIATYRESAAVHGDPSIDNILVSSASGKPLIIDPAPDGNIINGAVFDMGKFMQSFYCGYEFLFRDEDVVELNGNSINYRDHRSEKYVHICDYVQNELASKYLSDEERRAIVFHAGSLLIRRLKHQVLSSPDNALKMYAVGVKTLNEFLVQYEKH